MGLSSLAPDGERPRQAEKAVALCRRAWRVVHRLHPGEFDRVVPNPWNGVTMQRRVKNRKPAVAREDVYEFAFGSDQIRTPGSRRGGGYLFRVATAPRKRAGRCAAVKILHHKTGAIASLASVMGFRCGRTSSKFAFVSEASRRFG
jgi:hypothetical protein